MSNLVLVGPMGVGKTTVGKILACKLHYSFIDTDSVIEERTGADIPWIFDVEGEQGFRQRETAVLKDLGTCNNAVIATGGGIVIASENRGYLKSLGTVIYLTASLEQLVSRTYKDRKRPLLQVADPEQKIKALLDQRGPLYEEVADHIAMTDSSGTRGVVQKICTLLDIE